MLILMDIFFQDPTDVPLPPEEIRIRDLRVEPLPDQCRVRVHLEVTPFLKGPNIEIQVLAENGNEVASLSIIESIDPVMDFTMHLQDEEPTGKFTLSTALYYYADEEHQVTDDSPSKEYELPPITEVQVVDRRQATFVLVNPPDTG
jgi:hypothetical protein